MACNYLYDALDNMHDYEHMVLLFVTCHSYQTTNAHKQICVCDQCDMYVCFITELTQITEVIWKCQVPQLRTTIIISTRFKLTFTPYKVL